MKRIFRRTRHVPGAILCLLAAPALAEVTGRETVIDGDALEIRGQRIHLHGIDAPETGQTCLRDGAPWDCGRPAAELLHELTAGKRVVCAERATGGGRPLEAKCKAAWLDLGAEPVSRRMPMPPHGRAARSGGRWSGRARIGRSKGAAMDRPGPRLPAPGPLVGRPLVREGSFDRQAPPSYLKETLTFVR